MWPLMADIFGQGRYRVIAPLGAGAFSEVYEVEDTRLGVRRALKVHAWGVCALGACVGRVRGRFAVSRVPSRTCVPWVRRLVACFSVPRVSGLRV